MEFKKPDFLKNKVKKKPKKEVKKVTKKENQAPPEVTEDIKTMFYSMAPVDDEDEENNTIVGEKIGTTMNAEVMMERQGDENGKVTDDEEDLPDYSGDFFNAPVPVEEDVELSSDVPEGTLVADDVIESVPQFDIKPIEIEDIDTIDIDIPDVPEKKEEDTFPIAMANEDFDEEKFKKDSLDELIKEKNLPPLPKHEDEEEPDDFHYEKLFGKQKPVPQGTTQVSKVPIYKPESPLEQLNVNVGKFSVVVRQEYEEYLKSKNPEISATYKPTSTVVTEEPINNKNKFAQSVINLFTSKGKDTVENRTTAEKVVTVDDYDDENDKESVADEINSNLSKLKFQSFALGVLAVATLFFVFLQRALPSTLGAGYVAPVIYGVLNLIVILVAGAVSRVALKNGLSSLIKFKGNSDTAVAVSYVCGVLSSIVGLFASQSYFMGKYSYYTVILIVGLLCNSVGKYYMVSRVDKNFKFIADEKKKMYSAKIYTDENIASKMMSGTVVEKPIVAYQHKTDFLTNYLQLSYAPDPSEEAAGKIAPYTTICAIVVAILFGLIKKDFVGAISTLSLITTVSIPICTLMAVNVPMRKLCKTLLKKGAMLCGYQGVNQFCDTSAIMVDASELYPEGSIILNNIQAFNEVKLDESCLCAAAVLKEVNSPLSYVFDKALQESRMVLPDVESVMYEDGLGLVGWVNGDRILVGNRELMRKYSINMPERNIEETYHHQHKQTTFIAQSGVLVAMLITTYRPSIEISRELQRAEYNGISLLISTSDCNITSEQVSEDFGVFYRSVKVLPTGLGNVCKEVTGVHEEKSRAYLATRGKFTQIARALSGCVQMRTNISISVIIQLIGVVLGIMIMSTIALYAGTSILGTVEMLLYTIFWGIATMIVPMIKKP